MLRWNRRCRVTARNRAVRRHCRPSGPRRVTPSICTNLIFRKRQRPRPRRTRASFQARSAASMRATFSPSPAIGPDEEAATIREQGRHPPVHAEVGRPAHIVHAPTSVPSRSFTRAATVSLVGGSAIPAWASSMSTKMIQRSPGRGPKRTNPFGLTTTVPSPAAPAKRVERRRRHTVPRRFRPRAPPAWRTYSSTPTGALQVPLVFCYVGPCNSGRARDAELPTALFSRHCALASTDSSDRGGAPGVRSGKHLV